MLLRRVVHQWFHTKHGYQFECLRWVTFLLQFKTEQIEHSNFSDDYGTPHGVWALHWSEIGAYAKLPTLSLRNLSGPIQYFNLSDDYGPPHEVWAIHWIESGAYAKLLPLRWMRNTLDRERSLSKNSTLLVLLSSTMPSLSSALDRDRKHNIRPWQECPSNRYTWSKI